MLVRIGVAAAIVGVAEGTLRRWDRDKKLQPAGRTVGGHHRYESTTLKDQMVLKEDYGGEKAVSTSIDASTEPVPERVIGYARVSASKQRDDLERQKEQLTSYARERQWHLEHIYQDISSGLNDGRPGLRALIHACMQGHIDRIIITYDGRLARFGTSLLEWLFTSFHVKVERIGSVQMPRSLEEHFLDDLLALMMSFTGKFHRMRRGKGTQKDKDKDKG